MSKTRTTSLVAALGAALVGALLAMAWLWVNPPAHGQSWRHYRVAAGVVVGLLIVAATVLALRVRSRAVWGCALVVGLAMAAMRLAGAHYHPREGRPLDRPGRWWLVEGALDWVVMALGCAVVLSWLTRSRGLPGPGGRHPRFWLVGFVVALAGWIPYFLVYFPGILNRDSWSSMYQGMGLYPMTNHHPVLFNLWVGFCVDLARWSGAGFTGAVAIFAITQMVVLAAGLALVLAWLRLRFGLWPAVAALIYLTLDPSIALWSITMHKDTMFVLWMTLLTVLLAEASLRGLAWLARPRSLLALGALLLAISFSRNNGPYIAVALTAAMAVLVGARLLGRRLGATWRIVVVMAVAVAVTFTVQGSLYQRWGVAPSSRTESAGLMLHQVGWAAKYGRVTPAQTRVIEQMIPLRRLREVYQPTIVDAVKFDKQFDKQWFNDHPEEFQRLWLELMRSNPEAYTSAWYALAGGYLDPDRVLVRMDPGTKRGQGYAIRVHNRDLLREVLGHDRLPQRIPPAATAVVMAPGPNLAHSTALLFWACVLACCAALLRRRLAATLPYLPFLALVATLLVASPLTDYRYVAAGHVALAVLVAMMWAGIRHPGVSPARDTTRRLG